MFKAFKTFIKRGIIMSDFDSIHYNKTYLKQVVVRLDFQDFIDNDKIFNKNIIKEVTQTYPQKAIDQILRFNNININIGVNGPTAQEKVLEGIQQEYYNTFGNKIYLSNKFLSCEINNYTSFEALIRPLQQIITSIYRKNKLTVIRTGIRYINMIESGQTRIKKNFFSPDIAASLDNKTNKSDLSLNCIRSIHFSEFLVEEMILNFRYGMYNPEYPKILRKNDLVLDFDCFISEPLTNSDDIVGYITKGHEAIQFLFEKSITDSFRKVLRGNE